jgi:hypothetical protein
VLVSAAARLNRLGGRAPLRPSAAEDGSRTAVISSPASCWPAMAILSSRSWRSWFQSKVTKAVCGRADQPRIPGP